MQTNQDLQKKFLILKSHVNKSDRIQYGKLTHFFTPTGIYRTILQFNPIIKEENKKYNQSIFNSKQQIKENKQNKFQQNSQKDINQFFEQLQICKVSIIHISEENFFNLQRIVQNGPQFKNLIKLTLVKLPIFSLELLQRVNLQYLEVLNIKCQPLSCMKSLRKNNFFLLKELDIVFNEFDMDILRQIKVNELVHCQLKISQKLKEIYIDNFVVVSLPKNLTIMLPNYQIYPHIVSNRNSRKQYFSSFLNRKLTTYICNSFY